MGFTFLHAFTYNGGSSSFFDEAVGYGDYSGGSPDNRNAVSKLAIAGF